MSTMIESLSYTQANRPLRATTPLGGDALVLVSVEGHEAVSEPFMFTADFVATDRDVSAARLLGKPVTLHLQYGENTYRPVHGIVRRFASLGGNEAMAHYRAEIVPSLWLLTLSTHSRTFEKKSVTDIVEQVCRDAGVTDLKLQVAAAPPALDYVVQYRETDFAFVSRLLEGAGLYYTFEHTDSSHVLVISDAIAGSVKAGAVEQLTINGQLVDGRPQTGVVFRTTREHAVHAKKVAVADHALLRADDRGQSESAHPGAAGQLVDFLGDLGPKDSAAEAKRRIEQQEALHDVVTGASTMASLASGTRVKLTGGQFAKPLEVHLLRVSHRAQIGDVVGGSGADSFYENEFTAIPAKTRFRPKRATAAPSVRGTQTAKIVGTGGTGAIDVDKSGCVLLQFPWDEGEGKNGASAHRVHVASVWAGTGWGFVQHPRVGQEVLVEFLEGDPDRPIVTGRVYNSDHKPPYALPDKKTQSGWKSRTLGGGDQNFNEIRFDDDKGNEHVFVQAEKDLQTKVKNDETRDVLHDRTTTIKNNDTRTVSDGDDSHTISKGDQTLEITMGKQTETIKGNRSVTISQGNDELKISMGNLTIGVSMGNISIKANMGKITLEALQGIELKVGPTSVKLDPGSITLDTPGMLNAKGAMVTVEGKGMATVKAPMTQIKGDAMLMAKGGITMIN